MQFESTHSRSLDRQLPEVARPRSLRLRLLSGGTWALSGKIGTALAGLGLNILVAHVLSPEEVGTYFLTVSLVFVAAGMAQLGLQQTVVRLVAEAMGLGRPGRARAVVRLALYWGMGGALVAAGVVVVSGDLLAVDLFHSPLMAKVMDLAAIWVIICSLQGLLAETFRGFHDVRFATVFGGLVTNGLSVMLFAILWRWQGHSNLRQALTLSIVAGSTSTLLAMWVLRGKLATLRSDGGSISSKEMLTVAWPLLVMNLVAPFFTQASVWILGAMRPQEEVAIYGTAARLVEMVVVPLVIVNAIVPPLIAELHAQDRRKELERTLRVTATLAGIPAFLVLLSFILWGEWILGVAYGDYYRKSAPVLMLLSLGEFVRVWTGSCGLTLMMTGHQVAVMKIAIICSLIAFVLCLALVGRHGLAGVATATMAGMMLQNIFMWMEVRLTLGIWTHIGAVAFAQVTSVLDVGRGQ